MKKNKVKMNIILLMRREIYKKENNYRSLFAEKRQYNLFVGEK